MNRKGFTNKTISVVVVIIMLVGAVAYFAFVEKVMPISQQPTHAPRVAFPSQEECEQKTGKSCTVQMCDYIPPGKTFEEVCGKDFRKGWVPVFSP